MLHQALVDCSRGIILLPLGRTKEYNFFIDDKQKNSLQCKSPIVKGSLTRDFQLLVFSQIIFPHDSEYPSEAISNFYENPLIYNFTCEQLIVGVNHTKWNTQRLGGK
jgi:hypothetical protein